MEESGSVVAHGDHGLHVHGPLSVGGVRGPAGDEALDNVTVCAFYILNALGVINTSSMTSDIFRLMMSQYSNSYADSGLE